MYDLLQAVEAMIAVVRDGKRHPNYDKVCQLADEYIKFFTGKGIDEMLRQVVPREDPKWFKQRKLLTQAITVSILSPTKLPFQKVCRTRPSVQNLYWDRDNDRKIAEVNQVLTEFRGEYTLRQFLEFTQVNFNFFDPNAWIIIDFEPFNPQVEKARPYPVIVPSAGALDFKFKNNRLEYLIIEVNKKIIGYFGRYSVTFTLVDKREAPGLSANDKGLQRIGDVDYFRVKDKIYRVDYYDPKASQPPCWRVGYIPDPLTMGVTYVGIFHDALPLLHKTIKINSELDLSTALVAHPKVISYQSPCTAEGCNAGTLPDGSICEACEGTGIAKVGTSVQDAIIVKLPRDTQDLIDLDKLLVYKSPPIELLEFQSEYVDKLQADIQSTIFNADVFQRSEVSQTATERVQERDNLDDTLYPFAQRFAYLYRALCRQVAEYLDYAAGFVIEYEFPAQFNFKSIQQLLSELKASKDSGASPITIAYLQEQINDSLLYDQPEELRRQRIRNRLAPFTGYSADDIRTIIAMYPLSDKVVAWAYNEAIWDDLEAEQPDLWQFSFERIRELFTGKVSEYIERIKAERPAAAMTFGTPEEEGAAE